MNILGEAIVFATAAHDGAKRKGSDVPYIVHPLEAAAIAASMTTDLEVIAAAVLHDVVEDTPTTLDEVRERFGERVSRLVAADSENKRRGIPETETWVIRKQETLDFLETADRDEQIVVLADKLSNMRSSYEDYLKVGDEIWNKFNQRDKAKQRWYYEGIADRLTALTEEVAYKEYRDLLNKLFHIS